MGGGDGGSHESEPLIAPTAENDVDSGDGNEELLYAIDSFAAVLKPVSISMVLASIVVNAFQDDASSSSGGLSSYTVYTTSDADVTSVRLEKSFANSLIIVSFLAAATFGIVCLYKFRCMKVLVGYMMLSSVLLLGVMGGVLLWTTLDRFQIPCDSFTFLFICFNFGVVGVVSIFYQVGVPTAVTQGYLVATSVLMSWQLSHVDEWTGWCLLVTLAAYDLCAVLTPCGPLKALVNLMQERGEPMPGLLYEAALPASEKDNDSFVHYSPPEAHKQDSHHYQTAREVNHTDSSPEPPPDRSIKLGLGDFVFYSVLVSKASLYGFATAASCFLVIILGLGSTLVLLSVYKMALPALPISIGLGVTFYFGTRIFVVPMLEVLSATPIYF